MTIDPGARPLPGPIPPRVSLVIALTHVNSRHLGGAIRVAAAEFELGRVLEQERLGATDTNTPALRATLEHQLEAARQELRVIETERAWLQQELIDFDDHPGVGGGADRDADADADPPPPATAQ